MASMNENERVEYSVLMSRGRDAERTSHFCWIASGIAATMLLSWAVAARNGNWSNDQRGAWRRRADSNR